MMNLFKSIVLLGSLAIGLLLLTSCNLIGGTPAVQSTAVLGSNSPEPLNGTASTTCSATCASQGQCGTATNMGDGQKVVLLNTESPNLDSHNMLLGDATTVSILNMEERTVVPKGNQEAQQQLRFYFIAIDGRAPGWIAGWCVQQ